MTKEEALKTLMLLSALESWAYSVKIGIPDPYRLQLSETCELLMHLILKDSYD